MEYLPLNVFKVLSVTPHSNADNLEVIQIEVATVIAQKNIYSVGDSVIWLPPQLAIAPETAKNAIVDKYLKKRTDRYGNECLVVESIKLRGQTSVGLIVLEEGTAGFFQPGTTWKYEPSTKYKCTDGIADNPLFPKFSSPENYRHSVGLIPDDCWIEVTEKIHGTNSRIAVVMTELGYEYLAGSKAVNRAPKEGLMWNENNGMPQSITKDLYWSPYDSDLLSDLMAQLRDSCLKLPGDSVVIYGEIYGPTIQKGFSYGKLNGDLGYKVFDIVVNGLYLPSPDRFVMGLYSELKAPCVYSGYKLAFKELEEMANGLSLIDNKTMREGVVIRYVNTNTNKVERLKLVGSEYLCSKHIANDTTDE